MIRKVAKIIKFAKDKKIRIKYNNIFKNNENYYIPYQSGQNILEILLSFLSGHVYVLDKAFNKVKNLKIAIESEEEKKKQNIGRILQMIQRLQEKEKQKVQNHKKELKEAKTDNNEKPTENNIIIPSP